MRSRRASKSCDLRFRRSACRRLRRPFTYETSLGLDARRHEPGAPVGAVALERILDVAVRRAEVARLLLEQRELEVRRGRPGLHRPRVVGGVDGPRRHRGRPPPGSPRAGSGPASAPHAHTIAASATPTPAVRSDTPAQRTGAGRLPTADCRSAVRRAASRAPPGSRAPRSPRAPTIAQLPHPVDAGGQRRTPPARPASAATSGRVGPGPAQPRHRRHEARRRSRSRAAAKPTTPSSPSVSSHSECASRTNSGKRGVLGPPGLVRAGALAEHRLGLPLVDRRRPQLPAAAAGRAHQVRAGEVALREPASRPEGFLKVSNLSTGSNAATPTSATAPSPPASAGLRGARQAQLPVREPAPGPVRERRTRSAEQHHQHRRALALARGLRRASGPFTSASRASSTSIARDRAARRDRGRHERRAARGQRAEDDHAHDGHRRTRPARRSGRSRAPSPGPAPAPARAGRPAAARRPRAAAAESARPARIARPFQ